MIYVATILYYHDYCEILYHDNIIYHDNRGITTVHLLIRQSISVLKVGVSCGLQNL